MSQYRWSKTWIALGIIVSIVWAMGAWHHSQESARESAQSFGALTYKVCANQQLLAHDTNTAQCEHKRDQSVNKWLRDGHHTANSLFIALVPIPFIWLIGIILLYFMRAQIAGFRQVLPWSGLNVFKRIFLVICACFSCAVVLFGVLAVLNMYTDSKVPISPQTQVDVTGGNDIATAHGTWVRTDLTGDSIANPLQTSRIKCYRLQAKCIEATAFVSGTLLDTELHTFDVEKWTADVIVFTDQDLCATTVYTIDLRTNVVSGAGHLSNQDSTLCKMNFKGKDRWSLLLSNGFDVYWKLREQARPWPLRAIQGLFGN